MHNIKFFLFPHPHSVLHTPQSLMQADILSLYYLDAQNMQIEFLFIFARCFVRFTMLYLYCDEKMRLDVIISPKMGS